jgi:hypothetical protein
MSNIFYHPRRNLKFLFLMTVENDFKLEKSLYITLKWKLKETFNKKKKKIRIKWSLV